MAEPTLAAAFSDLRSQVGHYLGYQRDPAAWSAEQADDVSAVLKSGLRLVYNCGFDWSFLKPVAQLTLDAGANVVNLPDDYAQADGPVQVSVSGQPSCYAPLPLGPWQPVYQGEARQPDLAGVPRCLCEEPLKGTGLARGQRVRLRVYPKADRAYLLTFAYRLNADALSGALPYAYGGAQHAELFLQACKAAAERDIDNVPPGSPASVHYASFAQMLEASKAMDRRTKPHTVGLNRDRSDRRRRGNYAPRPLPPILVDGVLYD